MQSLRSKVFLWIIRNCHFLKFRLKPEVVDENFSVKRININEINAEWLIPEEKMEDKVILYIHGVGFISGSCKTHRMHVAKFAKQTGIKSLFFDYRLAPEHPFPAALEDCIAVYKWLFNEGYKKENIVIGGESVGGILTLSLLLALKEYDIAYA